MAAAQAIQDPNVANQELLRIVSAGDPHKHVIVYPNINQRIPRVIHSEPSISSWLFNNLNRGDVILIDAPWTFLPLDPSHYPETVRIAARIAELGVQVFGQLQSNAPPGIRAVEARLKHIRAMQQQIATECYHLQEGEQAPLIARWKSLEAEWDQKYDFQSQIMARIEGLDAHVQARVQGWQPDEPRKWLQTQAYLIHLMAAQVAPRDGRVFSLLPHDRGEEIREFLSQQNITIMEPVGDFTDNPQIRFEEEFDAETAAQLADDRDNNG